MKIQVLLISLSLSAYAHSAPFHMPNFEETPIVEKVILKGQEITRVETDPVALRTVQISHYDFKNSRASLCTGTLISGDLVVTAGHCIPSVYPADGHLLTVSFASPELGTTDVRAGVAHPKYKMEKILFGVAGQKAYNDIALIKLDRQAPRAARTMAIPSSRMDFESRFAYIAGFGLTGKGLRDSGTLRLGTTFITSIDNETSRQLRLEGPSTICSGDSGGPVFIRTKTDLLLVGVHSWSNCSVSISRSEELSQHLPWLHKAIQYLNSRPPLEMEKENAPGETEASSIFGR